MLFFLNDPKHQLEALKRKTKRAEARSVKKKGKKSRKYKKLYKKQDLEELRSIYENLFKIKSFLKRVVN